MQLRNTLPGVFFVAAVCLGPAQAHADAVPLDIIGRGDNRITLDGILGDWRRFTELLAVDDAAQVVRGREAWTGANDASMGIALARDEQILFVAAEVHDDQIVRTREHRANDDAVVISLSVPNGPNHAVGYDIAIYPGEPGAYRGAVRFRGTRSGDVPGAQVVEAPLRNGSGFTIEATIPWHSIPEILPGIASVRARAAYQDNDSAGRTVIDSIVATGPGDGQHPDELPPIVGSHANGVTDLIEEFRRSHNLAGADPFLDRSANIAGDASLERVVIFQGYVVFAGSGIAGGARYAFLQFPMTTRDDLLEPVLRDVTGDGRLDIVMRLQVHDQGLDRQVLYVYGAPNGADQVSQLFAAELSRSQGQNRTASRATYDNGGVRITFDTATGYTQSNYPRLVDNNVIAALTPWSPNRMVLYRWSDATQTFAISRSEPNPNAAASGPNSNENSGNAPPASPVMTQAPTDLNAVLASFRQHNGIAPDARATFTATANFAGDSTPETLQIFGRHVALTGAHFMNGRSYYSIELPANEDADVLALTTGDVTDDGRPEAIVRIRRVGQVQVRGHQLDVIKEYLLVYSMDEAHRGRVFAAEISRRVEHDGITNVVQPVTGTRNNQLVISAGTVTGGWNEQTYPFRDVPMQGFAPILLPWEPAHRVVYRWDGTVLQAAP